MKKDAEGRQFVALHDVRGALVSAAASLTTGTATTLLSAQAGYFLDLIEVGVTNNSTAAATVTLSNDGTVLRTIVAPAGSTAQLQFDAPLRQVTKNTPWIVDMEDITGTTATVEAHFIKKN